MVRGRWGIKLGDDALQTLQDKKASWGTRVTRVGRYVPGDFGLVVEGTEMAKASLIRVKAVQGNDGASRADSTKPRQVSIFSTTGKQKLAAVH